MKRFFLCLALGAGLLSCSETLTTRTRAGLAGTYDVALAGRYLFVTSSDRNELRVLDLEGSPRDFVRAPNPLEALSIPVLERPSNLTRDVVYAIETFKYLDKSERRQVVQDASSPLVYARSFGSREISVVTADDPNLFKERQRLVGQGLITAFAARGPVHTRIQQEVSNADGSSGFEVQNEAIDSTRQSSVLYYAEQSGLNAKLYRRDMAKDAPELLDLALPGSTVTALLVLPPSVDQPAQESLVIATRSTTGSGGETFRVEVNNTQVTRGVTYAFGAPVRALATHTLAKVDQADWYECSFDPKRRNAENKPIPPEPLAAGQYVFGILDESACGIQQSCSGVAAVDSATGAYAQDSSGLPMFPIASGSALPLGLTIAEGVDVNMDCQVRKDPSETAQTLNIVRRPLVGILTSSNGVITLFDAVNMQQFDLDPLDPSASFTLVNSVGTTLTEKVPQITINVVPGVTRTDTYRLLYELALPGLASVDRKQVDCPSGVPQGTCLEISADTSQVDIGDVVVLRNATGTCKIASGSTTELDFPVLGSVASTDGKTILSVQTPAEIPAECQSMTSLVVRASGPRPFVIFSDNKGYLGRMGVNASFELPGTYYAHPSPSPVADPKDIFIKTNGSVARGDQYVIPVSSHFLPYIFNPDIGSATAGLATYRLPGSVVYSRVGDTDLAYIAYPSADGILQVALETLSDNQANTTGLVPFE